MDKDKALRDTELALHAFLDCIIDGERIKINSTLLPLSVVERMRDAIAEGKLVGKIEI